MVFKKKRARAAPARRRSSGKKRRRVGRGPMSILITIPVIQRAAIEPLLGGNGITGALAHLQGNDPVGAVREFTDVLSLNFVGYKPSTGEFNIGRALDTYKLIALGYFGSKIATKLGVNRHFQKLPFVGKKLKL